MHFGWNVYTATLVGTMVFAVIQVWAVLHQRKAIFTAEKAASVSVIRFSQSVAYAVIVVVYGLSVSDLALIAGGPLGGIVNVLVLIGIFKYKRITRTEYAATLFFACCVAAIFFLPNEGLVNKGRFFLGFAFLGIGGTVHQIYEIVKHRDSGQVVLRPIIVAITSSALWTMYGFIRGEWTIKIISPTVIAVNGILAYAWHKYRRPKVDSV